MSLRPGLSIAILSARSLSLFRTICQNQIVPLENAELKFLESCIESGDEALIVVVR